jgi:hypothetical protein
LIRVILPRSPAAQAAAIIPLFVWLYGWQTVDLVEWRTVSAAPFQLSLDPPRQFLYGSPFGFMLGAYYQRQGLGFRDAFVVVHAIGLALLGYATVRALKVRCGPDYWGAAALLLATSPLLLITLQWIGKDDTFLLAFYLLLISTRSGLWRVLLAVLMVACHRELAVAMLVAHLLVRRDGGHVIVGAIAGVAGSLLYTHVLLSQPPATRIDYVLQHGGQLVARAAAHPFIYFAAALGPFWIYVLRPAAVTVARLAVLLMAGVLASITLDFTRVFVLVALPLLLVVIEDLVAELREAGGVWLLGRRWPVTAFGWLAFAQIHLAGDRLTWLRGLVWTVSP